MVTPSCDRRSFKPHVESYPTRHTWPLVGARDRLTMAHWRGFWTRAKLGLLRRYLDAFTTASMSLDERLYPDLFGIALE
jgi:hypothetical protein